MFTVLRRLTLLIWTLSNYLITTICVIVSERVWEFERATLLDLVNGTVVESDSQGLLIVTLKDKQNGIGQNGTVCVEYFDSKSASMFCQVLGFANGWWENYSVGNDYFE